MEAPRPDNHLTAQRRNSACAGGDVDKSHAGGETSGGSQLAKLDKITPILVESSNEADWRIEVNIFIRGADLICTTQAPTGKLTPGRTNGCPSGATRHPHVGCSGIKTNNYGV